MVGSPTRRAEPRRWRPRWPWLVAALAWALAGCGGSDAEALLVEYQRRLAETLALPLPSPAAPGNLDAFPGPEVRLYPLDETREGLLGVYALRDCHIAHLVAARNNQLGKVAPPSQRWLHELALWRRLSGCWNTEVPATLGDAARQRLARLTRIKTEQLPKASWNALFDSREWVGNFSRASAPLPPGELAAVDTQLPALAYLREATLHQFDRRWQPDSPTLEGHLQTLQRRPLTAELLRALILAEVRLREASALLETALTRDNGCPTTDSSLSASPEARRLEVWLTALEGSARRWLEAIDRLLAAQLVRPPPAVADYRRRWLSLEAPGAPLPAFIAARRHHQALRATLLRRCR